MAGGIPALINRQPEMNAKPGAKPVLSNTKIDSNGALRDTFNQLFTDAAKANKDLGWFCYNDEDRLDAKGGGTGPGEFGHCKGRARLRSCQRRRLLAHPLRAAAANERCVCVPAR